MSAAEDKFYRLLLQVGIPATEIEREVKFCKDRAWRADFRLPKLRLLIEVDGGVFSRRPGRHIQPDGYRNDCDKQRKAVMLGYAMIRTTTDEPQMCRTAEDVGRLWLKFGER